MFKKVYTKFILFTILYLLAIFFLRLPFWQNIDTTISLFLIDHRIPMLTNFFLFVTHFADSNSIVCYLVILTAIFLFRKEYKNIFRFIGVSALCGAINSLVKMIVSRERPPFSQLLHESSSSFPSGHSSASFSFFGNLGLFLFFKIKNKYLRILVAISSVTIFLLIGFSRLYLGVHWFTDIIGGYCTAAYSMSLIYLIFILYKEKVE